MAIDMVQVPKPQIRLIGNIVGGNGWVQEHYGGIDGIRIDHARTLPSASTVLITGVTSLDKEDLLAFSESVRVIITGMASDKPTYVRQSTVLGTDEFEGSFKYSIEDYGKNSETWFTYNGKDPVRTKAYLYNFRDWDDFATELDPSAEHTLNNVSTLGFVLRNIPTGNNLVTVKAKTYWRGSESKIAVATFKISQDQHGKAFYQPPR